MTDKCEYLSIEDVAALESVFKAAVDKWRLECPADQEFVMTAELTLGTYSGCGKQHDFAAAVQCSCMSTVRLLWMRQTARLINKRTTTTRGRCTTAHDAAFPLTPSGAYIVHDGSPIV